MIIGFRFRPFYIPQRENDPDHRRRTRGCTCARREVQFRKWVKKEPGREGDGVVSGFVFLKKTISSVLNTQYERGKEKENGKKEKKKKHVYGR